MTKVGAAPFEIAVIEFPGGRFDGEFVPALAELVDSGTITIVDLVLISRRADGSAVSIELSELTPDDALVFDQLDGEVNALLSDDDIDQVARVLSLGSSAAVVVWENTWAHRLIDAVSGAGGQVVAHDRLDTARVRQLLDEATG